MAKGKKTGGKNFEVGNTYGQGSPQIPQEIKESRAYTRAQLMEAISKYLLMSLSELSVLAKDNSLSSVDHIVLRIIINAISKGDQTRLDFLLDRIHGKVKQVIENVGERPQRDVSRLDEMHREFVMLITSESKGLLSGGQ